MPPKRVAKTKQESEPVILSSSDNESEIIPAKSVITASRTASKKPSALVNFSEGINKTSTMSDRLQLAQAINNLVYKGDAFTSALEQLHELTNERLTELDLQIESKQQEYDTLIQKIENDHTSKINTLQKEFVVLEKELKSSYENNKKDLERNFENVKKDLELTFKNSQIETTQKLREYKLKACATLATENNMLLVEKSDYDKLISEKTAVIAELKQLKDKFDNNLKAEIEIEKGKFNSRLQQEKTTMELTYKMQTADVNAQVTQLQKEVTVLNKMIENLNRELAEQRNLTKEVASSAARSAINQTFGNK